MTAPVTDRADVARIYAAFLRQVYLAEKLRMARMAGLLPVPDKDPLGHRLLQLARRAGADITGS